MLKKILLLILISLPLQQVLAQTKTKEQKEVEQMVVLFFDALTEASIPKMKETVTEDFLLLEDGMVWNIDTLAVKFAVTRPADFKRLNSFDFFNTIVKGNLAWTNYENTAVITRNQKETTIRWLESAILEKTRKGWRIRVLHSTVIRRKL
ncbi:nuclear transport factor 2 family protein [Telluribacter humicola]|uniref:nuclear transport factor 2 family protein n=1 Tax=Telluribacter humicola TaxID=1720261 RepID=UPI001A95FB8A|nr:nuclear transport factor 2 family protein [Telluribacter humicola]